MKLEYRVQTAVSEVEPLLNQVRQDCPELLDLFPRPIEDIAVVCGGNLSVHVMKLVDLTEAKAAVHLRDHFKLDDSELDVQSTNGYLGLLVCQGSRAFVFCDPSLGEACFRFTLAHELGHLFNEYMPKFSQRGQLGLFEPARETHFAHRDGVESVAQGLDGTVEELRSLIEQQRRHGWSLNEVKANAFAAELLAPVREVRRLILGSPQRDERVSLVMERFGLSNRAAEIRVDELIEPARVGWLFGGLQGQRGWNSSGNGSGVKGTKAVTTPLQVAMGLVVMARFGHTTRSGLRDLVARSFRPTPQWSQ